MADKEETKEKQEKKVEDPLFTKEELEDINKDIATAKESLISKETEMKIEEMKKQAKNEAKQELEAQQKFEQQEKENQELKKQLEAREKEAATKLESLQKKVDEMIGSKAAMQPIDPFKAPPPETEKVDSWSDDKIEQVEEASARAFFGDDLDDRN